MLAVCASTMSVRLIEVVVLFVVVEIVELRNHPFFVGVQFHPEFKSKPTRPHPLFREFVAAAVAHSLSPELADAPQAAEPAEETLKR